MSDAAETATPTATPMAKPLPLDLSLVAQVKEAVAAELSNRRQLAGLDSDKERDFELERADAEDDCWKELDRIGRARSTSKQPPLDPELEARVVQRVIADLFGLGGFEPFLNDESVEDIYVNGCDRVFLMRAGKTVFEPIAQIAESDEALVELVNRWASRLGWTGRRFDRSNPRVNLKLPGGFRLHAIMEVTARPTITIRCPRHLGMTLAGQVERRTVDERLAAFLGAAVHARCNIIVSGGTSSGKTTFLRSLLFEVPPEQRIITIEDTAELLLSTASDRHPNVVELETREANAEGVGAISMMDLTREVLRMSPERVIVGEVRGAEALYMLKAMSQGNDGSMCTIHADSARGVASRVRIYVAEGAANLPVSVTDSLFSTAVDLVVHMKVLSDAAGRRRRVVSTVLEIEKSFDADVRYNELFRTTPDGVIRLVGRPSDSLQERLAAAGLDDRALQDLR